MSSEKYIYVTEFIEVDLKVPDLGLSGNSQIADRFLHNPLHNLVINLLQDIHLTPETVIYIPSQNAHEIDESNPDCEWKSTSIPQYFTETWLLGATVDIGLVQGLEAPINPSDNLEISDIAFTPDSENPLFNQMINYLALQRYTFPQRPEYTLLGFSPPDLPLKPYDSLLQQSFPGEEEDLEYLIGINQILAFGSDLTPISFPLGTGIQLQYSDILLSKYSFLNPSGYQPPEKSKVALRFRYRLEVNLQELYRTLVQLSSEEQVTQQFQAFGFSLPFPEGKTYQNLSATSIENKIFLPPGKSKSYAPSSFLASSGSLIAIQPLLGHHTPRWKMRLEINGKSYSLHKIKLSPHQSYGAHLSKKNICLHLDSGHLAYHALKDYQYQGQIRIKEANQVLFRLIGYHFNPHSDLIEGSIGAIIYWIPEGEISLDLKSDDLCQPLDLQNRIFCHC